MSKEVCPKHDEVCQFAVGELRDDILESIELHLTTCELCRELVERCDSESDEFERLLKESALHTASPVLTEPEYLSAVNAICHRQFEQEVVEDSLASTTRMNDKTIVSAVAGESNETTSYTPNVIRTLGQYELLEEIGRGGMGVVYAARHRKLDRPVAIKILPDALVSDAQAVLRFENEIKSIGRIDHPNIVRAIDADEIDDVHVLAMELVDGRDLSSVIKERGPIPASEACKLIRQVAVGLQHVHEDAGLVHRDIKPRNLMLSIDGTVRILDLGLARLIEAHRAAHSNPITSTGQVLGTIDYMAPEQAAGNSSQVDARADIYGLGATFYALLTGRAPFANAGEGDVLQKLTLLATQQPTPTREMCQDVPRQVCDLVQRMMAKDPAQRLQSASDVIAALDAIENWSPSAFGASLSSRLGWKRWAILCVCMAVLVAVAVSRPRKVNEVAPEPESKKSTLADKAEEDVQPTFRSQYEIAYWVIEHGGTVDAGLGPGQWKDHISDKDELDLECIVSRVSFPQGTEITPAELRAVVSPLPHLKVLGLGQHRRLLPEHVAALTQCRSLSSLSLGTIEMSTVNDEMIAQVIAKQPELHHITIHGLGINGTCIFSHPRPKTIDDINIGCPSFRSLTDQVPSVSPGWVADLRQFPSLTHLSLPRVKLSPAHFQSLGQLASVKSFENFGSPNLNEILDQYGSLSNLEKLDIRSGDITDENLHKLHNCKSIRELVLGNARVSDDDIKSLQQHLPSCRVVTNAKIYEPLLRASETSGNTSPHVNE